MISTYHFLMYALCIYLFMHLLDTIDTAKLYFTSKLYQNTRRIDFDWKLSNIQSKVAFCKMLELQMKMLIIIQLNCHISLCLFVIYLSFPFVLMILILITLTISNLIVSWIENFFASISITKFPCNDFYRLKICREINFKWI